MLLRLAAAVGLLLTTGLTVSLIGCGDLTGDRSELSPQPAEVRLARRAFSGAPPVIPHPPLSGSCTSCHTPEGGREVARIGIAPANPHTQTPGMSGESRCRQCHVFRYSGDVFVENEFAGYFPDDTSGMRRTATSAPVIPHASFMREDCLACHSGPAARPEITCPHAHRNRCRQCHVHQQTTKPFQPEL